MMSVVKHKTVSEQSRLNFRLSPEIKARVARAAGVIGQDLTEFAVATLNQRAVEILDKHDCMLLGSEDYRFFLDALADDEAREPSEKSRKAAERYAGGKRKGVRYHLAD
jgi:uncharacterized protein (DUF1778 family)